MFVTNLALPLTRAVGHEPQEDVTRWNPFVLSVTRVKSMDERLRSG